VESWIAALDGGTWDGLLDGCDTCTAGEDGVGVGRGLFDALEDDDEGWTSSEEWIGVGDGADE